LNHASHNIGSDINRKRLFQARDVQQLMKVRQCSSKSTNVDHGITAAAPLQDDSLDRVLRLAIERSQRRNQLRAPAWHVRTHKD
jgi:hypothetical protein